MRLIDADALISDCQLAQKQADRHGREFANAFYSGCGEISTEWWCVEDMIENAPTIESEQRRGEWCHQNDDYYDWYECSECGYGSEGEMIMSSEVDVRTNFCPNCGADMRGGDGDV